MSRQALRAVTTTLVYGLLIAACAAEPAREPAASEGRTPSGLAWDRAGSGPPIILVHGAMLDRRQWTPQQPLTDHFTVIRYDTRWHGQSAGADSTFRAADDLAEVLDAVGVDRATIVGLSNGARIAVDFALAYPSRVERLVLASPGLGGYQPVQQADFWAPMLEALGEGDVAGAAALLAASPVMYVEAKDSGWVGAMVREQAGVFSQDPSRELADSPPAIRMLEMIRAPTLVISGESDLRDIVWTADTLEQGIIGSQRLIVPGARHLLNITHADQFNRAVIDFLGGRRR